MQTTKASSAKTVDGLPLEKVQVLAIGLKLLPEMTMLHTDKQATMRTMRHAGHTPV